MKRLLSILSIIFIFLFFVNTSFAIYDPLSTQNNKYGIHILFPEEISEAANLINSTGGDWGYVTIPIRSTERNMEKWQKFMDDCKKYHVIPLLRIATEGDYFIKASWEKPSNYYVIDFANFLSSLDWPTKNRYVIIFNETNRGDEWGGTPNASEYADILNNAVDIFKERSDKFFIIMGGLDNASVNIDGISVNQFSYMNQMNVAVPGIFAKIDGLAVHSYPNPAFASPPSYLGTNSIYSFSYENDFIQELTGKTLPIFITETGWSTESVPIETQIQYYKQAFENVWSDKSIVAVTPFILHADQGPFRQFSFIVDNKKNDLYLSFSQFLKVKGQPQIEPDIFRKTQPKITDLSIKSFKDVFTKTIFNKVDKQTKDFFKWMLNI